MKVLVLGGTGAIGEDLVSILNEEKFKIYVTSRRDHIDKGSIHFIKGNAMDYDFLSGLLQQCHWDCIIDFMAYTLLEFSKRIEILLQATNQYIFLSSSRVYDFNSEKITEFSDRVLDTCKDKKFLKTKDYSLEKARQEELLISQERKNWTIIRPYKTYSSQRLQLGCFEKEDWLYRCIMGRSIVFSKDIIEKVTSLSASTDVAMHIYSLIGNENVLGEVYQTITGDLITWGEILNIYIDVIEEYTGRGVELLWGKDAYSIWKGRPDYTVKYDVLKNHYFSNEKISKIVGEKVQIKYKNPEEGIKKNLSIFLSNPNFKNINWIQQGHFDKLCQQRANLQEISTMKDKIAYLLIRYTFTYNLFVLMRKIRYRRFT